MEEAKKASVPEAFDMAVLQSMVSQAVGIAMAQALKGSDSRRDASPNVVPPHLRGAAVGAATPAVGSPSQ